MGPGSGNPAGQNRRHLWRCETEFGFVQKSRSINDLERIQAQNRCLRPDLRLNWVLLARTPGCASRSGDRSLAGSSLRPRRPWPAAAEAWRSRAASSSAWILACSAGAIAASSRSGGRSWTGRIGAGFLRARRRVGRRADQRQIRDRGRAAAERQRRQQQRCHRQRPPVFDPPTSVRKSPFADTASSTNLAAT